ncbi:MAG: nucleotide exchange factor GrpE [Pseudomonadota bacterium]
MVENNDSFPGGGETLNSGDAGDLGAGPREEEKDWRNEADKFRDLYLRSQAEMENMKRRLEREKTDFFKYANHSLVKDLLPVLDNLERAVGHACSSGGAGDGLAEGIQLTIDGFRNVMERFGVKSISAVGEKFDPNFHEAVMQRESSEVEENTILEEVQKGYILNDRLVRPTMVIVSRRPAGE